MSRVAGVRRTARPPTHSPFMVNYWYDSNDPPTRIVQFLSFGVLSDRFEYNLDEGGRKGDGDAQMREEQLRWGEGQKR